MQFPRSSTTYARRIAKSISQLASGELTGRLCAIATLGILGHRHGAAIVGLIALAQGISQYLQPLIDFGLRHTGARLVAKHPGSVWQIVEVVQSRRTMMVLVALPLAATYVFFLPIESAYKFFVLGFAAFACIYAFSLDWLAWGKEKFRLLAYSRAIVPAAILAFVLAGWRSTHALVFVFLGHATGQLLLVSVTRFWWKRDAKLTAPRNSDQTSIEAALQFRRTAILGLALFSNMAFNTVDVLLLGIFRSTTEVGLYSASYRILNQALITYYLLTQSLYPQFAKLSHPERTRMLRPPILMTLFGAGAALSFIVIAFGEVILRILFGESFVIAAPLLSVLAVAIPLDFLTSYLSSAYVAWGMERKVLVCTATAALTNVLLNVALMPTYGARAAAINTVLSYSAFLISLFVYRRGVLRTCIVEPSLTETVAAI